MKLEKVVLGFIPGWPIRMGYHRFAALPDGRLAHYMGDDPATDDLRATVPPEGFEGYVEAWPECRAVVDLLKSGTVDVEAVRKAADPGGAEMIARQAAIAAAAAADAEREAEAAELERQRIEGTVLEFAGQAVNDGAQQGPEVVGSVEGVPAVHPEG